jgi:hypothetical protein
MSSSEAAPTVPEVEVAAPAAPAAECPVPKSKMSKKTIILIASVLLVLFIMASLNKRITKVQKRNAEIIKVLKNAELLHGHKKPLVL